ncbi:MAG: prephenate dehydrogenase/arogenate dehydrogenase family protein [Burkholderiaceae bacterium]
MKLALIGVGLIGGSFALAAKAAGKFDRIVAFDSAPEALQRALALRVIDEASPSAARAVIDASLVMIATPVAATQAALRDIATNLTSSAVVTDVGSTKGSVIEGARSELGAAFSRFVPGHPIAGREHSGVEFADAALFRDKVFVSVPAMQTDADALRTVETLWRDIGCRIERMTPEEHDSVFAAVSHLPHLLAFALVAQIVADSDAKRKFALAGAGFRDFTRIAASSPALWSDVCIANREAIGDELRQHRGILAQLQQAIDECDREALQSVFTLASEALREVK